MRTVYLGTSEFGATVLAALAASRHRPSLVVTQPDRRKGRGQRLAPPPVAEEAQRLELPLLQPANVNSGDTVAAVAACTPDVVCMCAYGQLIKEPLIADFEMLNVHPSLLPRWRGAAPIERAIVAGDAETGVSIMRVVRALDAGDVCMQVGTEIDPLETGGELAARLAVLGGETLVAALDARERTGLTCVPQIEAQATYAEKIVAADRHLDLSSPADEVARVVRAFTPHIGAYLVTSGGERLKVAVARPAEGSARPGEIRVEHGHLLVGCGEGMLDLIEVQPPGKRSMPAKAYLAGHRAPERFEL